MKKLYVFIMCSLWESGWKERYYRSKFEVDVADYKFRKRYSFVRFGILIFVAF